MDVRKFLTFKGGVLWLAAIVLAAGMGGFFLGLNWHRLVPPPAPVSSGNSLFVINPYKHNGTWVFDDPGRKLFREPFVSGAEKILDMLTKDMPGAAGGFRLIFSDKPFPGSTHKIVWRRKGQYNGDWYFCEQLNAEGWLCPALLKFFADPPGEIHFQALPQNQ